VVGRCLLLMLLFTTAFAQMEGTFSVYLLSRFLSGGPVALEGGLFVLSARADAATLSEASLRAGWLFMVVGLLSAAIQGGLVRRLVRWWPRRGPPREPRPGREARLATAGFLVTSLGLGTLPLAPTYGWLFPVMALLAVGSALVNPSLSALVSLHAPPERLGMALGAYQSFGALGRILGPALGGLLFARFGPEAPYGSAAVLVGVGGALAVGLSVRGVLLGTRHRSQTS
jgi:MFS transporter, DHA1 family, tetracycline resistance protein